MSGRRRGPAGLMQDSDHDPLQGRGMHFHFTARLSSSSERTSSLSLYVDLTHTDATGQISRLEGLVQDGRARDPPFHLHLAAHFGILKAFSKRVLPLSSHQHTFEFINLSSLSAMPPSTFGDSTTAAEAAALFAASIVGKVILVTGASIGGLGGETARVVAQHSPKLLILAGRSAAKCVLLASRGRAEQELMQPVLKARRDWGRDPKGNSGGQAAEGDHGSRVARVGQKGGGGGERARVAD